MLFSYRKIITSDNISLVEVKTEVIIRMYNFDDVQYTVILSAFYPITQILVYR